QHTIITETEYSPLHVNTEFVKSISVNGYVMGTREYDGYGRLLTEMVDSNRTSYIYNNGEKYHHKIVLANGQELNTTFNQHLHACTQHGMQRKVLDTKTGLINYSIRTDTNNEIRYKYRFDGLVTEELTSLNANVYDYTLTGLPLASSSNEHNFESIQYDDRKRILMKHDSLNRIAYKNYDNFSRVTEIEVRGESNIDINIDYSQFPEQVVTRTVQGTERLIEAINFGADGKISSKTIELNGKSSTESYIYNEFSQLIKYNATGERLPKDQFGNFIKNQTFSYDSFGNVSSLETIFSDDSKDIANFGYDHDYPTRLMTVHHTHPSYTNHVFSDSYDIFGRLVKDEKGYRYSFNEYGEMKAVYDENGILLSQYTYDAQGRLASQSIPEQPSIEYIYSGQSLISQKQGNVKTKTSSMDNRILSKNISGIGIDVTNTYFVDS
ncbi:hypothetical protein C1141_19405, partial [Vibrio agarivorans]